MDGGARDRRLMKAFQLVGDLARPEMVGLSQVEDFADDVLGGWRVVSDGARAIDRTGRRHRGPRTAPSIL
jgi:hypothetical protein